MRALLIVASLFFVACGPAPSVELAKPVAPVQPAAPAKPNPATPNGPATGDDSTVTAPTPPPLPVEPRLRAVCTDDDTLVTTNSMVSASAGMPSLNLRFANTPVGHEDVISVGDPLPLESGVRDQFDVLFTGGRGSAANHDIPLRYLLAKVDLPTREGVVTDLGARVPLAMDVANAAGTLGLQVRNHGTSDQGTYLLIPRGNRIDVVSHSTLTKLATVALDPARTVMPQIFESESVMTALVYERGTFKVAAVRLTIQADGSVSVAAPSYYASASGSSFYSPSWLETGKLVWVESDVRPAARTPLTFVNYDVRKGTLNRAQFNALTSSANERLSPQATVLHRGNDTVLAIVAEVSEARTETDPIGRHSQLVDGRLIYLKLTSQGPVEVASYSYPGYLIAETRAHGFDGRFAIRRVLAPTGAREAFLSIDAGAGRELLFKERGGSLDGVGAVNCANPNVIQEVP